MNTKEPQDELFTVAVVIPACNIGTLVARAIDSVLAQTRKAEEIIVVDDGSTDDTASVIKSYGSKVHYVYQANLGLAGARNTGIRAATCEWVAFLDGDDEWLPDNLKLHLEVLKRNPNLVWSAMKRRAASTTVASETASARPRTSSHPTNAALRTRFVTSAATANMTGVRVSPSA